MQIDFRFDGQTYDAEHDKERLKGQLFKVYTLMHDGRWRTLSEIAEAVGCSEASASARLRDTRKPRFGGHTVNRRPRGNRSSGLFEYQLIVNNGRHENEND